jgi:hypothetical protein
LRGRTFEQRKKETSIEWQTTVNLIKVFFGVKKTF